MATPIMRARPKAKSKPAGMSMGNVMSLPAVGGVGAQIGIKPPMPPKPLAPPVAPTMAATPSQPILGPVSTKPSDAPGRKAMSQGRVSRPIPKVPMVPKIKPKGLGKTNTPRMPKLGMK